MHGAAPALCSLQLTWDLGLGTSANGRLLELALETNTRGRFVRRQKAELEDGSVRVLIAPKIVRAAQENAVVSKGVCFVPVTKNHFDVNNLLEPRRIKAFSSMRLLR